MPGRRIPSTAPPSPLSWTASNGVGCCCAKTPRNIAKSTESPYFYARNRTRAGTAVWQSENAVVMIFIVLYMILPCIAVLVVGG